MKKKEEIREGIARIEYGNVFHDNGWDAQTADWKDIFYRRAQKLIEYLHSQGVVIED